MAKLSVASEIIDRLRAGPHCHRQELWHLELHKDSTMPDELRNEYTITLTLHITVYAQQAPSLTRFAEQAAAAIDANIPEADCVEVTAAAIRGEDRSAKD